MKHLQTCLILFLITITSLTYPFTNDSTQIINETSSKVASDDYKIKIDRLSLEIEVEGQYVNIKDTIPIDRSIPLIVNGSSLRVNATITNIDDINELVYRGFYIDVYTIVVGEEGYINGSYSIAYRYHEPIDVILPIRGSKTEIIIVEDLHLPAYADYKFVFSTEYHVYEGDEIPVRVLYESNQTFQLIASVQQPPYVVVGMFYITFILFIGMIAIGFLGSRKEKSLARA